MMPRMNETSAPNLVMRHVIAALVTNEPGVLAQVAGMFAARGFNIDSLVVGRTENPELSRMTIVVNGDSAVLEQVRKQLQKLVPVVKVVDYQDVAYVERDLVLVQVSTNGNSDAGETSGAHALRDADKREEIITLANLFRAKVVDVASDQVMVEIAWSFSNPTASSNSPAPASSPCAAATPASSAASLWPKPPQRTTAPASTPATSRRADASLRANPKNIRVATERSCGERRV